MSERAWWDDVPGVVGEVTPRSRYSDPLPNLVRRRCERSKGRTPATCLRCVRVQVPGEPFRRLRCTEGER